MTTTIKIRAFLKNLLRDEVGGMSLAELLVLLGLILAAVVAVYPTVSTGLAGGATNVAGQISN
jgi:Flp pilus assembly pilin Flp